MWVSLEAQGRGGKPGRVLCCLLPPLSAVLGKCEEEKAWKLQGGGLVGLKSMEVSRGEKGNRLGKRVSLTGTTCKGKDGQVRMEKRERQRQEGWEGVREKGHHQAGERRCGKMRAETSALTQVLPPAAYL